MRRSLLEYSVVQALVEGEAYPADLIGRLGRVGLQVPEGTVYPLLNRLKADGYVEYRWEESPSGPPRKYYSLSAKGLKLAEEYRQAWEKLKKSVDSLNTSQNKHEKNL
ncbi:MAG: PadR family transcriptional regulator [Flavobacteriales bacterium]|nr:PadR family transcriptional regulator [Flavobacteriales bacterium]MDW8409548.1 PadR family transcriptional regulator [Flavobacteriales bacterium]